RNKQVSGYTRAPNAATFLEHPFHALVGRLLFYVRACRVCPRGLPRLGIHRVSSRSVRTVFTT
ncbi:MAG TPA: hypothetical protein VE844_07810, partial [Gammaproteobacteria bacterium]|nr:hypothetical protein [Gammaproteobacteria bacterium]